MHGPKNKKLLICLCFQIHK